MIERLPENGMGERIVKAMLTMRYEADGPGTIAGRAECAESTVRRWLPILRAAGYAREVHRFGWWTTTGEARLAYPDVVREHNPYATGARA